MAEPSEAQQRVLEALAEPGTQVVLLVALRGGPGRYWLHRDGKYLDKVAAAVVTALVANRWIERTYSSYTSEHYGLTAAGREALR